MPSTQSPSVSNRLLSALPCKDRERLLANCEQVELIFTEVLYRAGELIPHVYLPTGSVISLMMSIKDNIGLEIGLVGDEGILGITLILGVEVAPFDALVQGPGAALRITVPSFLRELEQSPALQLELNRYLFVSMRQVAQTAACNRFHVVEERLARRLLMTQDRTHADSFHITHVFLAYILGVRRVGITKAAYSLQQQKLIRYQRGNITILDRAGLEAASCRCYRTDKETYEHILGDADE